MRERITREQFEQTKRDWDLASIERVIDNFRTRHVHTIESGDAKELNFDEEFPPELRHGFAAYLSSKTNPKFLDAGGGEGKIATQLTEQVPQLKALILDLYPPKKEGNEALYSNRRILYVRADLDRGSLPVQDRLADLSVATHVSLYLDDPLKLINELIRATKPGGYIMLDGAGNLFLDKDSRGENIHLGLFFHIATGGALEFYFNSYADDNLVIKVNDPSFQIAGFELNQDSLALTKGEKFDSAMHSCGKGFIYRKVTATSPSQKLGK